MHLYIHAVEASSSPQRAENAADTLLDLIPDAGHLVHMPSHIYWRIGRYHDAAEANARAIAYLKLGDPEAAQAEYLLLSKIRTNADLGSLDEQDYPATQLLQIADELVQAEILMARKDYAEAITAYKTAVLLQDRLPYMEPPFWYYPTRLSLGKALIEAGDSMQAEMVYRDNLKKFPKNGWALLGLKQSLQMQGKDYGEIQKAFDQAWRNADVSLTASRF